MVRRVVTCVHPGDIATALAVRNDRWGVLSSGIDADGEAVRWPTWCDPAVGHDALGKDVHLVRRVVPLVPPRHDRPAGPIRGNYGVGLISVRRTQWHAVRHPLGVGRG